MKTSTSSRLTRVILAAIFSEKVCMTVVIILGITSFFFSIADHPRLCSATVAIMLPWFIVSLRDAG